MKTWKDCCNKIAKKHKLGESLVTGHKAGYYEEAATEYAKEVLEEAIDIMWNEYRADATKLIELKDKL